MADAPVNPWLQGLWGQTALVSPCDTNKWGQGTAGGQRPVVTLVSPAQGAIGSNDLIVVDVTDDTGLGLIVLSVFFPNAAVEELVYKSTRGLRAGYQTQPNQVANVANGLRFTLRRLGGWPGGPMVFDVDAVDNAGQEV